MALVIHYLRLKNQYYEYINIIIILSSEKKNKITYEI